MINYLTFADEQKIAVAVAELLLSRIKQKPSINLGLATGGTMESIYAQFYQLKETKSLDLSKVTSFNLDEYIGLGKSHPQSYYYYMQEHLFSKLAFDPSKTHLPRCGATDLDSYCKKYSDNIIKIGGLDLQLLGIGTNGHIGFNEPGTPFTSRTHVVELSQQTREDNSRFFKDINEVPNSAITLGLQDIFEAKEVILVATGNRKAEIIKDLIKKPMSESLPASILHKHKNATIYIDYAAAALL